jgi:hypothetical protein
VELHQRGAQARPGLPRNVGLSYLRGASGANDASSTNAGDDMTDPRNVAHDKKVQQAKKHQGQEIAPGADKTPEPGKKTHMEHHASDVPKVPDEAAPVPTEEKPLV